MTATDKLDETYNKLAEPIGDYAVQGKQALQNVDKQVRAAVQANPLLAAMGALTLGFFVGRTIARR